MTARYYANAAAEPLLPKHRMRFDIPVQGCRGVSPAVAGHLVACACGKRFYEFGRKDGETAASRALSHFYAHCLEEDSRCH